LAVKYSVTKQGVTEAQLARMVRAGFGTATVTGCDELTDGTYNAAYRVRLSNGADLVLKVAPPPDLPLLTHEVDLMRTEVDFYERAGAAGVPVPAVRFADLRRRVIPRDYVFLQRLESVPLDAIRAEPDLGEVRRDLGAAVARLHTVTGPAYGYPLRGSRSWQPTWRAAFLAMLDDILDDAVRLDTQLPEPPARIRQRLHRHAAALDAVPRPALVHFDLWDGNVFVHRTPAGWRLSGLIDGERAFFGDPYAEFVSLSLFRHISELPELLDGYAAGGGEPVEFTDEVRVRIALYTCYLYLLVVTEGSTRGFDPQDPVRRHTLTLLGDQLAAL
jgi:aminoglycoside phosphotransferase (APT) family kinase protein